MKSGVQKARLGLTNPRQHQIISHYPGKSIFMNADHNNPGLKEGDHIDDYRIKKVTLLELINSFFYELEHLPTGAAHVHISNDDKENTFGVTFKTVPSDSSGVAHILEHTALCGSEKFPVRDPFFSMLKRSLSTFMNALTASDWTMYPFSTQNRKDFYNLMDVYLDAAFFPNLDNLSFKQEGHRMEIEDEKLVYKGVVYNEMKGAMSSPDQVLVRSLMNALYPSTTYSNNSGGDPAVIPSLTYHQLKAFHKRHYHPSNAFFYTYGNLPLKDHLAFIRDKLFSHTPAWERIDPKTDVPCQPRWDSPKEVTYPYPLDKNEDASKKCQVCVAWLTTDIRDPFEVLALALLEHILLGNSASPLRKALIDSGLGSTLSDGTGFDADNRDTFFGCGLKDVRESDAADIETIIIDTLKTLADKGIDRQLIDSAIHQAEFHRKEITNSPYPYGMKLLLSFASTWLHRGDPARILRFDDDLKRLNDELSKGPFFENRIKTYFLDNPHKVLFKLVPDQMMEQKENELVRAELDRIQADMPLSEIDKIKADTEALEKLQESAENISVLPTLELGDIPPSVQSVPEIRTPEFEGAASGFQFPISVYQQPTSDIFYFSAAAGVGTLEKHLFPLVPFFCYAFPKVGTARRDYAEMVRLIDAYTGGVGISASSRTGFGGKGDCLPFVSFNGKCLVRNQDKLFDIMEEILCEFSFSDLDRLKNLLSEYRAGLESAVLHNGHGLAISLASRNFSITRAIGETWGGIYQLQTIKNLTDNLTDDAMTSLAEDLTSVGKNLSLRDNFKAALVGEENALASAFSSATSLQNKFHGGKSHGFLPPEMDLSDEVPREGWSTSSAVSFVARAFKTVRLEHEDSPVLTVIGKLLRSLYLHREIREKGGAYGVMSVYNAEDGQFCFGSYRDPHIVSTLDTYENASAFIRSGKYSSEDIKEAILQICSDIDKPDSPGHAAIKAFYRKIISLPDETRKRFKERLLAVTRDQVMDVAEKYFAQNREKQAVAVISSEDKLKSANEKMPENPLSLHRI